jgi:hypothetical protein
VIEGSEARYILEHKATQKAFADMRASLEAQMRSVKPRDKEMHTELIRWYQTLDRFERCFRETIRTGELAKAEIQHKQTLADQAAAIANRVFSRD